MLNLCFCITEPSIAGNLSGPKGSKHGPERTQKWEQRRNKNRHPVTKCRAEFEVTAENNQWSSIWVCSDFRVSDHIIHYLNWSTEALLAMRMGQPGLPQENQNIELPDFGGHCCTDEEGKGRTLKREHKRGHYWASPEYQSALTWDDSDARNGPQRAHRLVSAGILFKASPKILLKLDKIKFQMTRVY